MAWIYSLYEEQATDTARLTMLNKFIGEITTSIHADYSLNGRSINTAHLESLLSSVLYPRRRELELSAGVVDSDSPGVTASFVRGRPI